MRIIRSFVPEGTDPFSLFSYEQHRCLIMHHKKKDENGNPLIIRDMIAECPSNWSVNAKNILIDKYLRKAGVPSNTVPNPEKWDGPEWLRPRIPAEGSLMGAESSVKQTVHRIVGQWTYEGFRGGWFDEVNAKAFYDELIYVMLAQMAAPNSPQWFNCGIWWAYGIEGKGQGQWYVDLSSNTSNESLVSEVNKVIKADSWQEAKTILASKLKESSSAYRRVSAHACFQLTLNDTLRDTNDQSGILDWYTREGIIFKYGSGNGVNVSNLRAEGEPLSSGGKSSGVMSWAKVADYSAGAIKSGGANRRAAKLLCMNLDHPDIMEFIHCKTKSECAVAAMVTGSKLVNESCQSLMEEVLKAREEVPGIQYKQLLLRPQIIDLICIAIKSGVPQNYLDKAIRLAIEGEKTWMGETFDVEYEGGAYQIVPYQNANNSVRVTQSFYDAVDKDMEWATRWRTNNEVAWKKPAKEIERQIALAGWFSGDPGVQYDTNINDWNVTPNDGRINSSNPCCFAGNTWVKTSESGIKISDLVSRSSEGRPLPLAVAWDDKRGDVVLRQITKAWCAGKTRDLIRVNTKNGLKLECTEEHQFLLHDGKYLPAQDLLPGMLLRGVASASDEVVGLEKIRLDEEVPVYDIEVDGAHNFAVSIDSQSKSSAIIVHNSEHMRLDDSACNLASIRITNFYDRNGFKTENFVHVARLLQIALDITVQMAHLPSEAVAMNVYGFRDTGLGYADLGSFLMSLGVPYASDEGRAVAAVITALMHSQAYLTSAEMAEELGAYPRFWKNKEEHLRCVKNHLTALKGGKFKCLTINPPLFDREALSRVFGSKLAYSLCTRAEENYSLAINRAEKTGFRNAEVGLLAPTGTLSLVMDCDTTGIEPMLALLVYKTLAGGGTMVIEPANCVREALINLGYHAEAQDIIAKMKEHAKADVTNGERAAGTYLRSRIKKQHHRVFDTSLGEFPIAWEAHILIMSAVQPFLGGAISKTCNMPSSSTVEDIRRAYRMGNDKALKSLAVFRDGCKLSQPLNLSQIVEGFDVKTAKISPWIDPESRMKLGGVRKSGIDVVCELPPGHLYLKTSCYPDGNVGEIWVTYTADQGLIQAMLTHTCKTANVALQFGVPLEAIIRSWQDSVFEPKGFVSGHNNIKAATSIMNLIARLLDFHVLGNTDLVQIVPVAEPALPTNNVVHTPAVEAVVDVIKLNLTGDSCPQCGSNLVVPSGTNCKKCQACGYAGGCG